MRRGAGLLVAAILGMGFYSAARANNLLVSPNVDTARVYPNPWRADRHANFQVTFEGLPSQTTVKIFTLSGHAVRTLTADASGKVDWDRKNSSGDFVASGVYLYLVADKNGHETLGKLAIIR